MALNTKKSNKNHEAIVEDREVIDKRIKKKLDDAIQNGNTLIALPALLDGLLQACHANTEVEKGSLSAREALYEHIFCPQRKLAGLAGVVLSERPPEVWSQPKPNSDLKLQFHHLSSEFVAAGEFVLDKHRCEHGKDCRPMQAWQAVWSVLQVVQTCQDIPAEADQRECAHETLDEIQNKLTTGNLARWLWPPKNGEPVCREGWLYHGVIYSALRALAGNARDHADGDLLFAPEQWDTVREELEAAKGSHERLPTCVEVGKIEKLFDTLIKLKPGQLRNGNRRAFWDCVFKSGLAIPEQLLLEQILRLAHIKRLD